MSGPAAAAGRPAPRRRRPGAAARWPGSSPPGFPAPLPARLPARLQILLLALLCCAVGAAAQQSPPAASADELRAGAPALPVQLPQEPREGMALPDVEGLSGLELMQRVHERHQQYPFVFERQSMVLEDRDGQRETRLLRRFSRVDDDGTARMLLLFDAPREVEGVALLATRRADGHLDVSVYLPALRGEMIDTGSDGAAANFLGTDFTIENLVGEVLDDYRYVRRRTRDEAGVPHHQVDVFARDDDPVTARPLRRHHIRADNLFIASSEHFDGLGRVEKRQTVHDLRAVDGTMWRGNMILMEDLRARHSTLLRIERRVFSRDYVPAEMFSADWILANRPHRVPEGARGIDPGIDPEFDPAIDPGEPLPGAGESGPDGEPDPDSGGLPAGVSPAALAAELPLAAPGARQ